MFKRVKVLTISAFLLLVGCASSNESSKTNSSNTDSFSPSETTNTLSQNSESNTTGENSDTSFTSSSQNTTSENVSSSVKPTVDSEITNYGTYIDALYGEFNDVDATKCQVEYKLATDNNYSTLDKELIRQLDSNKIRFDIVGLKQGMYDIKITTSSNKVLAMNNIEVTPSDRSGYAFFKNSDGVGAYNNDGTLKKDAVVVYVDENNKNTVSANSKVGIAAIIKAANGNKPLCVRIISRITSDTRDKNGNYQGIYSKINGLTDKPTSDGTYYNMLDVSNCKNITLEGIGSDAEIFQWGISFNKCSSIEVKNLTFTDYSEDACGVDGDTANPSKYSRFFIHNNHFNVGKNLLNDTPEKDKGEGDGSTDVKGVSYCTYAYNSYYKCHKTGLVGGSDSDKTSHLTFHHNYYRECYSRLPLGRDANMHYYNNLFDSSKSSTMDLRANAYVFSEANYFYKAKNPVKVKGGAVCKSYNDVFDGVSGDNNATKVTSRTQTVSNNNAYGKNFDTDSANFYYDSTKQVSDVYYLTDAKKAKEDVLNYAGPYHINPTNETSGNVNPTPSTSSSSTSKNTSSSKTTSSSKPSTSSSSTSVNPKGDKIVFNPAEIEDGDYTTNFNVGDFEVVSNGKKVSVYGSKNYTSFDKSYTKALKFSGSGSKDTCSLNFTLSGSAQIKIYSLATGTRTLQLCNYDNDEVVNTFNIDTNPKMYERVLGKGKYYIASQNSSAEIGAIEILYLA